MGAAVCTVDNTNSTKSPHQTASNNNTNIPMSGAKIDKKNLPVYTMEEVRKHNTAEDFWCVIMYKVYKLPQDIVEGHSGGEIIMEAAGKDATELFEDGPHGEYAREELANHLIGRIEKP